MGFNISRYRQRIERKFEVEVVTPMFLGGSNVGDAELRAPSLKGALRFWWRATCEINDLKDLREKEGLLFGDTSNKAPFSVCIENPHDAQPVLKDLPKGMLFTAQSKGKTFRLGIIDYLAYGLRESKNGYSRRHYPAGSKFTVKFVFTGEEQQKEVLRAFYALIHFGGLGARSRNGFGGLALQDPVKPKIKLEGEIKKYSSTSNGADLFLTKMTEYGRWEDALSAIGLAYKDSRLSLEPKHSYAKRRLIAKPIVQDGKSKSQRHAKPYFMHVGKLSSGKYYGQILYLPYQYMAGHKDYSKELLAEYMATTRQMNQKLNEILAGGAR